MQKKKINRCVNIKIPAFHTYLIKQYIDLCQTIKFSLLVGSAQIYGIQLKMNYPHTYSVPCSIPVYSWEGADVRIQWVQYQGIKNSEEQWIDITEELQRNQNYQYNNENGGYNTPMVEYLEINYNLIGARKLALQGNKFGPVVAVIGNQNSAPQNVSKLLLNYSGKYNMNPIFVDIDPQNSSMFIQGSVGALQFQYKILQDLFDRPDKLTFYYGNRSIKRQSYLYLMSVLKDCINKKLIKQRKQYLEHGTHEEYPYFVSGIIIQFPRLKSKRNKNEQFQILNQLLEVFQVTHTICVGCNQYYEQIPKKNKVQKIKTRALEGTQAYLNLPRPIRTKIQKYFGGESKRKTYEIDSIILYQLISQTNTEPLHCRKLQIREQAISKNIVAILHAKMNEQFDKYQIAQRVLNSSICCLIHIYSIEQDQVTFEAASDNIFQDYKDHIWITSATDQ